MYRIIITFSSLKRNSRSGGELWHDVRKENPTGWNHSFDCYQSSPYYLLFKDTLNLNYHRRLVKFFLKKLQVWTFDCCDKVKCTLYIVENQGTYPVFSIKIFLGDFTMRPKTKRRTTFQRWTRAQDAQLRKLFPNNRTSFVAQQMHRTPSSIEYRANKLGLRKSQRYLKSIGKA